MADEVDSTSTAAALLASCSSKGTGLARRFLELIRFSHTIFALPFAGLACAFALALPQAGASLTLAAIVRRLLGVLICMVTARSAAMALNRLADARIDAANPRTAARHLPAGLLSERQVKVFFAASSGLFVLACLLFLPNWLPLAFALPVLAWICGYSYAKRFTAASHLWLGAALALAPVCAWIAIRGEIVLAAPADVLPACGLGLAIACWVSGFDIIYACQDAEFDRRSGLNSVPARFGVRGALRIAAAFHLAMLLVLALLPSLFPQLSLGWLYYWGLAAVAALVLRQHSLVNHRDLTRLNIAFFNINALISIGFSLIAGLDAWWP